MNFAPGGAPAAAGGSYAPATYQRLMRLAARAFYSGACPPPGRDVDSFSARSKIAKMDTRGLGVVLIDYLTTVEWTSFDLLAETLKLHPVVLSRALRFLEIGHMVRRYERRESRRKKRNIVGEALEADVAQGGESEEEEEEDEEGGPKKKGLLTEYFTIDYARAFDALQIRIHAMRASLKEQLEASNAIQAYRCPGPHCGKTYTSLDAANLVDPQDLTFKCEMCGSELVEQRATNDADGSGAPQHATARESKEAARKLLQAIDRELAPLTRLMADLQHRGVLPPDAGELYEWARRVKQREADMTAAVAAGGAGRAGGGAGGSAAGRGGGVGGGAAGGAPAALLAGSGVTVLSAADNTNTWESQDFKVSLDGGAGAAGGGGGSLLFGGGDVAAAAPALAAGGKKAANVLPWFMKVKDGQGGEGAATGEEGAVGAAASASAPFPGGADSKQQQQAEYFKDFMAYMSQLQQEKRPGSAEAAAAAAAPALPVLKPDPGLAPALPPGPALPRPAPPPVAAAAVKSEPSGVAMAEVVKQEPGMYDTMAVAAAAPAAAAAAVGDVEWEDMEVLPPPLTQPKVEEEQIKTEPGAGFGGGVAAMDADGDVEWEDV